MNGAEKLYTAEMLALAVELPRWPYDSAVAITGNARSPACGSTIAMNLSLDSDFRIEAVGMRVRACAVGQAAAAIFARHAAGHDLTSIEAVLNGIEGWLTGRGSMPDWPDLSLIAAARDFPGRHGAMMLPWKAATVALSNSVHAR